VVRRAPARPLLTWLLLSRDPGGADIHSASDRRASDHVDDVIQRTSGQREDVDQRERMFADVLRRLHSAFGYESPADFEKLDRAA